jgi:hypothetical protein
LGKGLPTDYGIVEAGGDSISMGSSPAITCSDVSNRKQNCFFLPIHLSPTLQPWMVGYIMVPRTIVRNQMLLSVAEQFLPWPRRG